MTVQDNVRKDALSLTRISENLSISQAKRVVYDYGFLAQLIDSLGIKDLSISGDFKEVDDNENIVYCMEDNLEEVERLADRVLRMFKNMDFYCYRDPGYASLKTKHKIDILFDFLDSFFPELLKMYKDMRESNHIFIEDLGEDLGLSFILPSVDSYYIAINEEQEGDINNLETLIHEILHVYSIHFLRNYGWNKTKKLFNGFSNETVPLYGELAFFDYLVRNNIIRKDAYFHRNLLDYNILEYFKMIKFFCYFARKDKDSFSFPHGLDYEYSGEGTLDLFEDHPFMHFETKNLKSNALVNFAYGMGSIEAYNLLRIQRRGENPKDIIHSFLLSQDDDEHLAKSLFNADLSFMKSEIRKHQLVLETIRPIPGYRRR